MPRIRTLKPEHRQHRKVGKLSDRAYRLWVSMICEADDEGRLVAEIEYLKAVTWPYQPITLAKVREALTELVEAGLVLVYSSNGIQYAQFPSWGDHQRINRATASTLPAPPVGALSEPSVSPHGGLTGEGNGADRKEGNGSGSSPPQPSSLAEAAWGTVEAFVKLWNEATPDECAAVDELSDGRRQKVRAALKQFPALDYWQAVMAEFHRSKFLRGLTPKRPGHESFQADLDWLLQRGKNQVENFVKVHEGKYRD